MHRTPKKKRNNVSKFDFVRMKLAFCFVCCLFFKILFIFVLFFHYIVTLLSKVNLDMDMDMSPGTLWISRRLIKG